MNNLEKALKKVKCAKLDGPTGPAGPTTVNVGNTYTINSNENAKVQNSGTNDNVILDFYIPKGNDGNGEMPKEICADGIIAVVDTNTEYSLVNLGKKSIYLKTPDLNNINSDFYFVNSPVLITIEYLGN